MVPSLDLISFILKIQSTSKEMWVFSVSKRKTALETKMRGIKMRTKKNKQYNVLLEKKKNQENSKNKGEVKGNHKKWKN